MSIVEYTLAKLSNYLICFIYCPIDQRLCWETNHH